MSSIPDSMFALEAPRRGPVSTLYLTAERPTPRYGHQHSLPSNLDPVLVKVEWAGLNHADNVVLHGFWNAHWPHVLGIEFSGTVAEVLPESRSGLRVGNRVWGCSAASIGVAGLTAACGLWHHLRLDKERSAGNEGITVLIHGAASCVGQAAAQLAKHAGYRVVGTASRRNHAYLRDNLGVDSLVDYNDDDFIAQLAADPRNHTLAHVFDAVGAKVTLQCFDILQACSGREGRVVTVHPYQIQLEHKSEAQVVAIAELHRWHDPCDRYVAHLLREVEARVRASILVPPPRRRLVGMDYGGKEGLRLLATRQLSCEKAVVQIAGTLPPPQVAEHL